MGEGWQKFGHPVDSADGKLSFTDFLNFFLFNEKLLHHSEPNRSNRRRMGMAVRVTIPIVKIDHDRPPLHPGHATVLLRGEDYMKFNRLVDPPKSG